MWYKYIYEFLFQTDPLFNSFLLDWIFPAFIVWLLYDFAFGIVGGLYESGFIKGRDIGSIIHWGIRYGIMWLTIQTLITIRDNWVSILMIVGGIIVFAIVVGFGIKKIGKG